MFIICGSMSGQNPLDKFRFPQVCIVEASAGSGKTYALARRYLELLINPTLRPEEIPLKNILAITFSNKAAIEMKARILDLLKKVALDAFSDPKEKETLIASLGVDFPDAQKKALCVMDELILNYNFFQVQTIDSFVNAILSACAFKLGLSAGFRIRTDASFYLSHSLDMLIDAAANDTNVRDTFRRFLFQYLHFENKMSWFPKENILETIRGLFAARNKYGRNFFKSFAYAEDLAIGKKKIILAMRALKESWPTGAHKTFEKNFMEFLDEHKDNFDYAELSSYLKREEFPLTKSGSITPRAEKLWEKIRGDLTLFAAAESALILNPYVDIFEGVVFYLKGLCAKDDVLFLDELNRQARFLFDEGQMTAPELYYRLAMRIKHIMIDEFQDTSPLQWENLDVFVREALSRDGSLFYVGDKKQAIYRFRGGDARLFDSVKEGFKNLSPTEEYLNKNFRSLEEIVLYANTVFSQASLKNFLAKVSESKKDKDGFSLAEEDAILKVFEAAEQSVPAGKDGGYVRLTPFESMGQEDRNAKARGMALSLIGELSSRYAYSDIAFLTRDNADVELLTEWFIEKNIPIASEKTLNIRNNALIKEVISFLKFLNSPIDNLSFASFLIGDIFLSISGVKREELHDFIFDLKDKKGKEKNVIFYREFRRRYPRIWEDFFEEFFKSVGFVPLYELTVSFLYRFRCLVSFADSLGFFMRLLELIREQEEEHNSLALFLDFFDKAAGADLYVRAPQTDAVKIMTIHKAKGLGFRVVVLPFLDMDVKVDPVVTHLEDDVLVLKRLHKKYRNFSKDLEAIYREEYLKSFIDELNGIYVALTRAKEELYIFLPYHPKRSSLCAGLFGFEGVAERGRRREGLKKEALGSKDTYVFDLPPSSYGDWLEFLARFPSRGEYSEARSLENRTQILRGEVFHYLLSHIGNLSCEDQNSVLKEAFLRARHKFIGMSGWSVYETALKNFFGDKKLRPFFFAGEAEVLREQEVVDSAGHTRRIDRIIVAQDEVTVIDYKTSQEENVKDRPQVEEYVSLLGRVYPRKKVSGILVYLDRLKVERVV